MTKDQPLAVHSRFPYSTPSRVLNCTNVNTLFITKKNQCRYPNQKQCTMPMKTEIPTNPETDLNWKRRNKEHQTETEGKNPREQGANKFTWAFKYSWGNEISEKIIRKSKSWTNNQWEKGPYRGRIEGTFEETIKESKKAWSVRLFPNCNRSQWLRPEVKYSTVIDHYLIHYLLGIHS